MIYSMPKNNLRKYFKFHLKVIVYVAIRFYVPLMALINAFTVRLRITCVVICLYVNDMLIFGTSLQVACETKKIHGI